MSDIVIDEITNKIGTSKKYKNVYEQTIRRVVEDCLMRYGKKHAENKAKNLLHQIWGSYYSSSPDFSKLERTLENDLKEGRGIKESLQNILEHHTSTKERIPIIEEMYQKIFSVTGVPNSIIDIACGLNPLTYYWMNLPEEATYIGVDIDKEEINFLNRVFKILHKSNNFSAQLGDIFTDTFQSADIVFMFKLLPLLHLQKRDSVMELLERQKCKYLVISFPIKSLSGREVGMEEYYSQTLKALVKEKNWKLIRINFKTELVFVLNMTNAEKQRNIKGN